MPLNFIATWETPTGNKKVVTKNHLIVGDIITEQLIRKSTTASLVQVTAEAVNFGTYKIANYLKVCARTFQRLVARTPMDETYKYIRLYDDDGNLNPHYETHRPDNDSVRSDWLMKVFIGDSYVVAKATDFDMTIFKIVDDDRAVTMIYKFLVGKINWSLSKIKLNQKGFTGRLGVKFFNNNNHFNKLEYGGYKKDSWHSPYSGSFYYHGAYGGFSAMAPTGFYRKTLAEMDEAFNASAKTGMLVTTALKRHCLKEIDIKKMESHYENLKIAGYKTIGELAKLRVYTDFRKVNINKLFEYTMKQLNVNDEISVAENIPTNDGMNFANYIIANYGKDNKEKEKILRKIINKFGIKEKDVITKVENEWEYFVDKVDVFGDRDEAFFDKLKKDLSGPYSKKILNTYGMKEARRMFIAKAEKKANKWVSKGRNKYLDPEFKKRFQPVKRIKRNDIIKLQTYIPKISNSIDKKSITVIKNSQSAARQLKRSKNGSYIKKKK